MKRMHLKDAKAQGFIVDSHVYPPLAYKGPRFNPSSTAACYTELESALLGVVEHAAQDQNSDLGHTARQVLAGVSSMH